MRGRLPGRAAAREGGVVLDERHPDVSREVADAQLGPWGIAGPLITITSDPSGSVDGCRPGRCRPGGRRGTAEGADGDQGRYAMPRKVRAQRAGSNRPPLRRVSLVLRPGPLVTEYAASVRDLSCCGPCWPARAGRAGLPGRAGADPARVSVVTAAAAAVTAVAAVSPDRWRRLRARLLAKTSSTRVAMRSPSKDSRTRQMTSFALVHRMAPLTFVSVIAGETSRRSAATARCRCAMTVPGAIPRTFAVVSVSRSRKIRSARTSR